MNETEDHLEFRLKHNYRDAEKVNLTQPGSPFRLSLMFGASGCKDRELWEVSRNLDEYFRKYRNLRSGDYEGELEQGTQSEWLGASWTHTRNP